MAVIPDKTAFQNSLASLPVVTYQPGETVIADGSKTGRLLILKKGTIAIVKEDSVLPAVEILGAGDGLRVLSPPRPCSTAAAASGESILQGSSLWPDGQCR